MSNTVSCRMIQVFRRLFCVSLNILGLFPYIASQQSDSNKLLCHTDNTYNYFMYTNEKNWYEAEKECKHDSREMSLSSNLIQTCTRYIYDIRDTVRVWRERTEISWWDRCYYLVYQNDRFRNGSRTGCYWPERHFVCYEEKETQITKTSTSETASTSMATTTDKTSTRLTTTGAVTNISSRATTTHIHTASPRYTTSAEPTTYISTTLPLTTEGVTKASLSTAQSTGTVTSSNSPASSTGEGLENSKDLQALNGGGIGGITVGVLLLCLVVILVVVFVIRRRSHQKKHKKKKHGASNLTYGTHAPNVIPIQGPNQVNQFDPCYFEVEPHEKAQEFHQENVTYYNTARAYTENTNNNKSRKRGNDTDNGMERNLTEEHVELCSYQDEKSSNYTYATSFDFLDGDNQNKTLPVTDGVHDNNATYDHINKTASPEHNGEENVYSHSNNDMNDEYSHTNFKLKRGMKSTPLDADDVYMYNHTGPGMSVEYSKTISTSVIDQSSLSDDLYSHTNVQSPVTGTEARN